MIRPWKLVPLFLAITLPATAVADTATDMRSAIIDCKPSCYEKTKFEGAAKRVKVCAYLPTHFMQERKGKGWGKLESSSAMSPIAVPSCKFPTKVPAKWKAVVAEAKKLLDLAPGDFVTVADDVDDWGVEKDSFERVTARTVLINHYSRNHEDYDRCRSGNPFAVCEGTNNEVTSFNIASYRVAEAKKLKQAGKDCKASSWDAVRQAVDTRKEREKHASNWQSRTYATRFDGILSEKELFAKNEALEKEARALWTDCGGKADVAFE